MSSTDPSDVARRNARLAAWCTAGFVAMIGAAYASVPLYRAFCELTGFDGTPRRAEQASARTLDRNLVVRFDANVRDLPWSFKPSQVTQEVKIGATGLAFYKKIGEIILVFEYQFSVFVNVAPQAFAV